MTSIATLSPILALADAPLAKGPGGSGFAPVLGALLGGTAPAALAMVAPPVMPVAADGITLPPTGGALPLADAALPPHDPAALPASRRDEPLFVAEPGAAVASPVTTPVAPRPTRFAPLQDHPTSAAAPTRSDYLDAADPAAPTPAAPAASLQIAGTVAQPAVATPSLATATPAVAPVPAVVDATITNSGIALAPVPGVAAPDTLRAAGEADTATTAIAPTATPGSAPSIAPPRRRPAPSHDALDMARIPAEPPHPRAQPIAAPPLAISDTGLPVTLAPATGEAPAPVALQPVTDIAPATPVTTATSPLPPPKSATRRDPDAQGNASLASTTPRTVRQRSDAAPAAPLTTPSDVAPSTRSFEPAGDVASEGLDGKPANASASAPTTIPTAAPAPTPDALIAAPAPASSQVAGSVYSTSPAQPQPAEPAAHVRRAAAPAAALPGAPTGMRTSPSIAARGDAGHPTDVPRRAPASSRLPAGSASVAAALPPPSAAGAPFASTHAANPTVAPPTPPTSSLTSMPADMPASFVQTDAEQRQRAVAPTPDRRPLVPLQPATAAPATITGTAAAATATATAAAQAPHLPSGQASATTAPATVLLAELAPAPASPPVVTASPLVAVATAASLSAPAAASAVQVTIADPRATPASNEPPPFANAQIAGPGSSQPPLQPQPTILPAFQAFGAALHRAATDERRPLAQVEATPTLAATSPTPLALLGAPVDTTRPHWPDEVMGQLARATDTRGEWRDATDTRIRLHPDALGAIDVGLRRDGDTVHVQFRAAEPATRVLLADAQPRLQEAAEHRGLRLSNDIGSGAGGGNGGGQPTQSGAQGWTGERRQPAPAATASNRRPADPARDDPDDRLA